MKISTAVCDFQPSFFLCVSANGCFMCALINFGYLWQIAIGDSSQVVGGLSLPSSMMKV